MNQLTEPRYQVFYANQLIRETFAVPRYWDLGEEIYQGGYVFKMSDRTWYRCDFTPVLIEDVPKELRALALLLN